MVSPAATEEIEVTPEEETEELETEEVAATAVVEELPPTPATPPSTVKRIHREWLAADAEAALSHHVTIGPSGGIEWVCKKEITE